MSCLSFNYIPRASLGFACICAVGGINIERLSMEANCHIFSMKIASRALTLTCAFPKENFAGGLQLLVDHESSRISRLETSTTSLTEQKNVTEIMEKGYGMMHDVDEVEHEETNSGSKTLKSIIDIIDREVQRRRKIGVANKGRIPWNKGKKHSEETRDLIKKRTIEALSDPKVRKKMSEYPRSHSDQSKARISIAQKRNWDKRLRHKRLREKWHTVWTRSIAEAARRGGYDQQELEWDSYEKMKADIMSQYLQHKADKARAKEIARLRAERAANRRAENAARLAERRRKEKEQKANSKLTNKSVQKKSSVEKKEMPNSQGLKMKARLAKFHQRRKQINCYVSIQREMKNEQHMLIEEWDIDQIKQGKMQQRASLADQIRAVKIRKHNLL